MLWLKPAVRMGPADLLGTPGPVCPLVPLPLCVPRPQRDPWRDHSGFPGLQSAHAGLHSKSHFQISQATEGHHRVFPLQTARPDRAGHEPEEEGAKNRTRTC